MLPDRVSNPGPLTYESGALPIALRGPAISKSKRPVCSTNFGIRNSEFGIQNLEFGIQNSDFGIVK